MRGEALHRVLLGLCLTLPWLNPFTSPPSAAALPLLLSWMLTACALLLVADIRCTPMPWSHKSRSVVLAACVLASVCWVPAVVDPALTAGLLSACLTVGACAVVAYRAQAERGWVAVMLLAWLVAAVLSSAMGLVQYLGLASHFSGWINLPPDGEAYANLRQRNQFATLTAIGLVALLGGWLWRDAQGRASSRRQRVLAWGLLNLLALGAAVALSRTGLIAWALVSLCTALWCRGRLHAHDSVAHREVWRFALAAPVLLVLWSAVAPFLAWALHGEWGPSLLTRIPHEVKHYADCGRRHLWDNALTMIAQQPWLGWGWGETDYAQFMTRFPRARFCELADNVHNLVLQMALDFGVPLALLLTALGVCWVYRRRPWRETQPLRLIGWGVLGVLLLHSLLEYPLWYGPFQMALGLAIGCLWSIDGVVPRPTSSGRAMTTWGPMVVGALWFLACVYAAWDYHRIGQIYRPPEARDPAYRSDPLGHAQRSWLFRNPVEFALLTTQTVDADNAAELYPLALRVMHYSPEARVVERAIDAARQLGLNQAALVLADQLQAAQASARVSNPDQP
jgi:O-antigen ligase